MRIEKQDEADLSDEQREIIKTLRHLLGQTFADRYVDFCLLVSGNLPLRVSRPLAAHALREFESSLRKTLKIYIKYGKRSKIRQTISSGEQKNLQRAAQALSKLGFDELATQRAIKALPAPRHHRAEIIEIIDWLGLTQDGEVATAWIALDKGAGKAHQRSFHHSLSVDDEFRLAFHQPFELVIREVTLALQRRYSALVRRVEELIAMPDKAQAVSLFEKEIPGALPLQWHFFERLQTANWLPYLSSKKLLRPPSTHTAEQYFYNAWPAGNYLQRMAASSDFKTRQYVADVLRNAKDFTRPDTRFIGIQILAALPPSEAAPFATVVASWLNLKRGMPTMFTNAPKKLVINLAQGAQPGAALIVARALLQILKDEGKLITLYEACQMREYELPKLATLLSRTCGLDAFTLFVDLLREAAIASDKMVEEPFTAHSHFTGHLIANDEFTLHTYSTIIDAVKTCAEQLIQESSSSMRSIVTSLSNASINICKRIALHVLSKNPAAAPELAQEWLSDASLIEDPFYKEEYTALALSWYPSLSLEVKNFILASARTIAGRHRDKLKVLWEKKGQPLSEEEERIFGALATKDLLWEWRTVLPEELQAELNETVCKYKAYDDWMNPSSPFHREESPLQATDFSIRTIAEIVAFFKTWHPSDERPTETVSELAYQWRIAVEQDSARYAAVANQFAGVSSIYIAKLLEGLNTSAKCDPNFDWLKVLELIHDVFSHLQGLVSEPSIVTPNSSSWLQACQSASKLLKWGLWRGAEGIGLEHAVSVQNLILKLLKQASGYPEIYNFNDHFAHDAFRAAQSTLRGSTIELCLTWLFWLSRSHPSTNTATSQITLTTPLDVYRAFEAQIEDRSLSGRIPRAILGRHLGWLFHFGADWTRAHLGQIFPATDDVLRQAAWLAYLTHNAHPVKELYPELQTYYVDELVYLTTYMDNHENNKYRLKHLGVHLLTLYLSSTLQISDELFAKYLHVASIEARRFLMRRVGEYLQLPPDQFPPEYRNRALAYWDARFAAATAAIEQNIFRQELSTIGQWVNNPQLETSWLFEQLLKILDIGVIPDFAFGMDKWLSNACTQDIDRALRILAALVENPQVQPQIYLIWDGDAIRKILFEAIRSKSEDAIELASQVISILSTRGKTEYLDLERLE